MTIHAGAIQSDDSECIEAERQNILEDIRRGLAEDSENVVVAVECVLKLRGYMWQRGLWSEWSRDVEAAILASEQKGLLEYAARLRAYLAGLSEARGRWDEVLDLTRNFIRKSSDPEALRDALFHRGTALHNLGKSRESLKLYEQARSLTSDLSGRAAIDHKVSRVLKTLGRKESGAVLLEGALDIARSNGDRWFLAELLLDKVGYIAKTDATAALELAEESRSIYASLNFTRGLAYAEIQCGRLLAVVGDECRAGEFFEAALRRLRRESYLPGQSHGYFFRGLVHLLRGSTEAAHQDFVAAFLSAREARYHRMEIATAAGVLTTALRGRIDIGRSVLLTLSVPSWWKVIGVAIQLQLRGAEAVLKQGLPA